MKAAHDLVLTAIFCDDIRHEAGNKLSFMGCYQDDLLAPTLPITLARLCVFATLLVPAATPIRSLSFRVVADEGNELARVHVPADALVDQGKAGGRAPDKRSYRAAVMLAPLPIHRATTLRVLAETDQGLVAAPSFRVSGASAEEASAP